MFSHFPRVLRAVPAILAGSLLAASAHAAVIYNPGPAVEPTESVVLDLPDGGKLEFSFGRDGNSPFLRAFVTADGVQVLKESALDIDALIDAESGTFVERLNLYRVRDGSKADVDQIGWEWASRPSGYLGFSFTDAKEEVRYGWVDLEISPDGLSVRGWAYEDAAGLPILAGARESVGDGPVEGGGGIPTEGGSGDPAAVNPVPEPGVLALLGIGALGLVAARKRAKR